MSASQRHTAHGPHGTAASRDLQAGTQAGTHAAQLRALLAERTGTAAQDWYLAVKARYALTAALHGVTAARGAGSVLTQTFTCCTAVAPIMAAGHQPIYQRIDADTLAPADAVGAVTAVQSGQEIGAEAGPAGEPGSAGDLRAVMIQHSFGRLDTPTMEQLRELEGEWLLIEDSAHCATRMSRDSEGRPLADLSLHSFGVEKFYPTQFGGAIWVNPELKHSNPDLNDRIRASLAHMSAISPMMRLRSRSYRYSLAVLARLPRSLSRGLRRALETVRLYEPAVALSEQAGGLPYEPMQPSEWMCQRVLGALSASEKLTQQRLETVEYLREHLPCSDSVWIAQPYAQGELEPYTYLPLRTRDASLADNLMQALRQAGIFTVHWYPQKLYPGVSDPAMYGLDDAELSQDEQFYACIVGVTTQMDAAQAQRACEIVSRYS